MEPSAALERVFREEAGRLTASLVRYLGDFDLAEELVADAMVEALEHWPRQGVPDRPAAWLLTTARHKGLDRMRRDARYRQKLELLSAVSDPPRREADDRLRLIFTCCHPALDRWSQIALTLRAVGGLTTVEIARAYLIPEPTLAKRIARAKAKIVHAGIPYRIPPPEEYQARLQEVLTVLYLIFNEGYLATAGDATVRRDLADDAEWLVSLLVRLMPDEPEPLGLLALIRLHLARWSTRLDGQGHLVLLQDQDRSEWDRGAIREGIRLIERAASYGRPGPYQVQAAIAALHCEARTWEETDWRQILALYTLLMTHDPSPVVKLNRAVALSHVAGPAAALEEVDRLHEALGRYHLFHATRAVLLSELDRNAEAAAADAIALQLATNCGERALIQERLVNPSQSAPAVTPAGHPPGGTGLLRGEKVVSELPLSGAVQITCQEERNQPGSAPPHAGPEKDAYMLPRLGREVNRLDLQHYALREALGANYLAPVSAPARILDVGSGTGQWAYELCREFPDALTVGVDIGRTNKPSAPRTYRHVQANVADGLPFGDRTFDFVHQRLLRPGIPAVKWPAAVRELARVTRLRGWLELVEVGDGVSPAGPATQRLFGLLVRLAAEFKLVENVPAHLPLDQLLSDAGMEAIETRRVDVPVGEWGGRPGSFMASDAREAFTALTPTFEFRFSIPSARTHQLVRAMLQELEEHRGTIPMYYAWARRPE